MDISQGHVAYDLSFSISSKCPSCVSNRMSEEKMGSLSEYKMTTDRKLSLAEVADHCDSVSCWIVVADKVYDVTEFLISHPGGKEIILENAGSDATIPFESKGHSKDAYAMLEQYCIGELVEKDRRYKT